MSAASSSSAAGARSCDSNSSDTDSNASLQQEPAPALLPTQLSDEHVVVTILGLSDSEHRAVASQPWVWIGLDTDTPRVRIGPLLLYGKYEPLVGRELLIHGSLVQVMGPDADARRAVAAAPSWQLLLAPTPFQS